MFADICIKVADSTGWPTGFDIVCIGLAIAAFVGAIVVSAKMGKRKPNALPVPSPTLPVPSSALPIRSIVLSSVPVIQTEPEAEPVETPKLRVISPASLPQ